MGNLERPATLIRIAIGETAQLMEKAIAKNSHEEYTMMRKHLERLQHLEYEVFRLMTTHELPRERGDEEKRRADIRAARAREAIRLLRGGKYRAEEAWKAWGFTDELPEDDDTYRLWKLLRRQLKEKGEER